MDKEWFSDWFDSPYYPLLYQKRDASEARAFLDALLGYLSLAPGSRVLDLACGRGRHSIYLAEKGFEVVGLDYSANSIAEAKLSETDTLTFYVHDMRRLFRTNYFDAVLNLFTSFGYFATEREHRGVLRNVADQLRPGGLFVLDFINAQKAAARLVPSEQLAVGDLRFELERALTDGYLVKTITVHDHGTVHRYRERVRAYGLGDLELLFAGAGLTVRAVFGDYRLGPFDPEGSDRLILVAEKKGRVPSVPIGQG
jgi:cyclopropane fatty-acyl-phospholipid synthase-like methyltransferase